VASVLVSSVHTKAKRQAAFAIIPRSAVAAGVAAQAGIDKNGYVFTELGWGDRVGAQR
jgi:hypothetical protein